MTPPAQMALAPLIAASGADGSGKSTLAQALVPWLQQFGPAQACYLGLGSDAIAQRLKRVPLVGGLIDRILQRKAARARDPSDRIPGLATALGIYLFSMRRKRNFDRMIALRRAGVTVITDRYPQTEVPGFYDGPGLGAARATGPVVRWLARRERQLYDQMAAYLPDLVIRLNIDVDTAAVRKPDHDAAQIAAKIAVTPALSFNGAQICDLDARQPLSTVLAQAQAAIRAYLPALQQRGDGAAGAEQAKRGRQ